MKTLLSIIPFIFILIITNNTSASVCETTNCLDKDDTLLFALPSSIDCYVYGQDGKPETFKILCVNNAHKNNTIELRDNEYDTDEF